MRFLLRNIIFKGACPVATFDPYNKILDRTVFEPGKSWSLAPLDRWGVFGWNRKWLQGWFTWFTCWFTWFVFVDSDWILIFCFSIVFCPDGTIKGPCSAGNLGLEGTFKVRLCSPRPCHDGDDGVDTTWPLSSGRGRNRVWQSFVQV